MNPMMAVGLALKIFQLMKGMRDDAPPGGAPPPPPASADHNQFSVEWLQKGLNKVNNAGLVVDGKYGEATRKAVSDYQKKKGQGLLVDGWAGVQTCAALYDDLTA
jgi:peptidoglycan hydrolase-like protein with peptidoglycan-binding domain